MGIYARWAAQRTVLGQMRSDIFIRAINYTYDVNGNMDTDGANNLSLTYNHLNLIENVEQAGTTFANYSYLADNTKLSATDASGNI